MVSKEKIMAKINLDFNKTVGKIKPMHAVGQPPFSGCSDRHMHYLSDAAIPYSRLHDVGGAYGANRFVDIPNIFRDFDADENDPASYDFAFTDCLLSALHKYNCEPIFRLGVTIENQQHIKAYRIFPPADYGKWARIAEHIIQHYNDLLQSAIVLAAYYPMLMNTGGNCGSQASTMVIRGMALGEIEWRDIFRVQWKELRVGFVCALVLSVVNFLRILIFEPAGATIAFVVSISLFATVILSKFIGCTMPLLAKKVRLDPALMATPLITTLVDLSTISVYFAIASYVFKL